MQEELTIEMYFELEEKLNLRAPEKWNMYMAAHGPFAIHNNSTGFWDTLRAGMCHFGSIEKAYVLRLYKEHCVPKPSKSHYSLVKALEEYKAKYEQSPGVVLLEKDPKFKEAAEKLAAKLLHAMMEAGRGRMVHRRERQSPVLFRAACVLLDRAGVGLGMGPRGCWLMT
jgi:sulfur relay (sulfurtransferase) DsrC/TusE family protein